MLIGARVRRSLILAGAVASTLSAANANAPSGLLERPRGSLDQAAARLQADRRIAELANKHLHDQCAAQELALASLRVQSESAAPETKSDWRLVLAQSELGLEKCYRESLAGLTAFIGRRYLLAAWGFRLSSRRVDPHSRTGSSSSSNDTSCPKPKRA